MRKLWQLFPLRKGDFGFALFMMSPSAFELFTHFEGYFQFARTIQHLVDRWHEITRTIWVEIFTSLKSALESIGLYPDFPLQEQHYDLLTLALIFSSTATGIYLRKSNRGQSFNGLVDSFGIHFDRSKGFVRMFASTAALKVLFLEIWVFAPIVVIAGVLLGGGNPAEGRFVEFDINPVLFLEGTITEVRLAISGQEYSTLAISIFCLALFAMYMAAVYILMFASWVRPEKKVFDETLDRFVKIAIPAFIVAIGSGGFLIFGPDTLSTASDLVFFSILFPSALFLVFSLPFLHWRSGYLLMTNAAFLWIVNALLLRNEGWFLNLVEKL